ncbi:Uncharacterised protein [Enterobacter hormaechei]|nr:Uncharacterised protein [Enterobacter hormaechei]SAD33998.1 Uncharacterised protein [Enterobacter hormaechei]VAC63491.1 Uncharacterised protein [Enterobacter hormaechei]VAF45929.1 Uncharacterised protein [Enterobacter hormaechei]
MQPEIAQVSHWYNPQTAQELAIFYCILCLVYIVIHLIWDFFSKETGNFSVVNLQYKLNEVYSSTTFATSGFFLVMLCDMKNPLRTSDAFIIPLILAMLTGFMISIAAIAPKKVNI